MSKYIQILEHTLICSIISLTIKIVISIYKECLNTYFALNILAIDDHSDTIEALFRLL